MADSSLLTVGVLKSYVGDSTTVGTNNIATSGNIQAANYYIGGVNLINIFYPIGSIYETVDSTFNPATQWGGTWERITDKFLVASGTTYSGTGGSASSSVTLTTENLPSHNHTFTGSEHSHSYTPAGSVSVKTNPTFSGSAVTSGAGGSHRHSFTPSGSVSSTFTGSAVTSGAGSAHTHTFTGTEATGAVSAYASKEQSTYRSGVFSETAWEGYNYSLSGGSTKCYGEKINFKMALEGTNSKESSHTHSVTASGSVSSSFTGTANNTGYESSHTHSVTASGTISGGAYTFSGTAATLKATQGGTVGSTGSGTAFSVDTVPPYQAIYVWKRTA